MRNLLFKVGVKPAGCVWSNSIGFMRGMLVDESQDPTLKQLGLHIGVISIGYTHDETDIKVRISLQ